MAGESLSLRAFGLYRKVVDLAKQSIWMGTILVLVSATPGPLSAQQASHSTSLAVVQTFRGDVSVNRAASRIPVSRNRFPVIHQDLVSTGLNSRAKLVAVDGKYAILGQNSRVRVLAEGRKNVFNLAAGSLGAMVTGRGRLEVATPAANAAAEGTSFLVNVEEATGFTTVTVAEGAVDFRNELGAVLVRVGQQSTCRPGEAPSRPFAADPALVRQFEATLENLVVPLESPRVPGPRDALPALLIQRQAAAQGAPNDPTAQSALGDVLLDLGRAEEALSAYQRASALAPNLQAGQLRVSQAALQIGRSDLATEALRKAETLDPDSSEVALAQGRAALSRGDFQRAVEAAARAEISPERQTLIALAHLRLNRPGDAEIRLRHALELQSDYYPAQAYLATALLLQGKTGEAEAASARAVLLAPDSALAREARGAALLFGGKPDQAVRELRRAVELDPLSATAASQFSRALAASNRISEAEREAARAVTLNPDDAGARTTLGVLFAATRDRERATREFKEALRVAPELGSARTGLAGVEIHRGRFGQALKEQQAALDVDAGSPQALNNLGVIQTLYGRLDEATATFQEALKRQPGYALARANLALAYLELNRYSDALREGEAAVRQGARSAQLHTTLARVYLRQNRVDRAFAELRRAEVLDPDFPLQYFYLAQVYRLQGRDRDGVRALLRGLTLDPGTAAEQRRYARVEGTAAGGDGYELSLRTSGRADAGRLTYFVSGAQGSRDADRAHSDLRSRFLEGILGYEPNDRHNLVLFTAHLDERGDRPGRLVIGGPEDPNFARDFTASTVQLLDRFSLTRRSYLTINAGYRRSGLFANNPPNPGSPANPAVGDPFLVRDLDAVSRNRFAEGQWEGPLGAAISGRAGLAYLESRRAFRGRYPDLSSNGDLLSLRTGSRPSLWSGWAEGRKRLTDRLDVTLGLQGAGQSNASLALRPKLVGHYRPSTRTTLGLVIYPGFGPDAADLLPVETWQQPFETGALDVLPGGAVSNYELSAEHLLPNASLLNGTVFYRQLRGLLLPTADGDLAPIVGRYPALRGDLWGGQLAYVHSFAPGLTARLFGRVTGSRDEANGRELPYLPSWQAGARWDYVNRAGIRLGLGLTYIGPRRDALFPDDAGRRLGGYLSTDARLQWQQNLHLNYFVQVSDLFNRSASFYSGYPNSGRTILAGIDFRL